LLAAPAGWYLFRAAIDRLHESAFMSARGLAHMVYFTLHEGSPENIRRLTASCYRHLEAIPGIVFFAAGPLVGDLARPVNDRDFHVGLQVVFASRADHDAYQQHPRHLAFIAENKPTWAQVRVFDSWEGVEG
jgi:hypothetical protein